MYFEDVKYMKQIVNLGPVQETLLIPLLSRALETARPNGLLKDPRAVEIVDQLDYDFDKWRGNSSLSVCCIRTRMFDEIALSFMNKYPDGAIVEIGCGLNTRFERVDNGQARWFELDLPDSIALRRLFFKDSPRRTMISGSVFDEEWMELILKVDKPTLFISEAVIIYFEESQVKQAIVQIAKKFSVAWFATDICTSNLTAPQSQKKEMRRFGVKSWFKWDCNDPRTIENWHSGIKLLSSQTFNEASPEIVKSMPFIWRNMLRFTPFLARYLTKDYRITNYRLGFNERN
jgi:O-methyltransferase involved in polyketide biosynthesis